MTPFSLLTYQDAKVRERALAGVDTEGALATIGGVLRTAESAAAYQELAMVEKKKGNVDGAARSFHRAEELKAQAKPRQAAKLITATATHLIQEGETETTMAKLKLAIRLDPNYAQAHYQLARILHLKHEDDDALAEFKTAFTLNSELKPAYDLQ